MFVSIIPIHGIPVVRHSFVAQGLEETLEMKVVRGQEILESNHGCHAQFNFENCFLLDVLINLANLWKVVPNVIQFEIIPCIQKHVYENSPACLAAYFVNNSMFLFKFINQIGPNKFIAAVKAV
jgi:hypothetical protein